MRKRFRGNKPVGASMEIEAGADEPRGQLYGGKSAFGGVKGTDGRDGRDGPGEKEE